MCARNNLFRGIATRNLNAATKNAWERRANPFDTVLLWQHFGGAANSHNADRNCQNVINPADNGNVTPQHRRVPGVHQGELSGQVPHLPLATLTRHRTQIMFPLRLFLVLLIVSALSVWSDNSRLYLLRQGRLK